MSSAGERPRTGSWRPRPPCSGCGRPDDRRGSSSRHYGSGHTSMRSWSPGGFVDVGDVPALGVRPVVGPRPGSIACVARDTATPSAAARPASGLLLVAGDVPVPTRETCTCSATSCTTGTTTPRCAHPAQLSPGHARSGTAAHRRGGDPGRDRAVDAKLLDPEMLAITPNGRQRTTSKYEHLLAQAGLRLTQAVTATAGQPASYLEATPDL
jgi:hypothetical protein